jgi:hypothetical protein
MHLASVRVGNRQPAPLFLQYLFALSQVIVVQSSIGTLDTIVNPEQVVQLAESEHGAVTVMVPLAVAFVQPLLLVVVTL